MKPLRSLARTRSALHSHGTMEPRSIPEVRVLPSADAAVPVLLDEVRRAIERQPRPLVSFATGSTFTAFLRALAKEIREGRIPSTDFVGTHLDEFMAFEPDRRGGMVHELTLRCPPLRDMLARGSFLPVPNHGAEGSMRAHEDRLQRAGGIALQFLGIGRNGHVGFNEPGTSFDTGFHVTTLADTTRADAKQRFVPDEPPRRAITAGIRSILAARRIVLCAWGSPKADAVRAMLQGDVSPACPASAVRKHDDVLVLLDPEAASGLDEAVRAGAAGG